MLCDNLEGWDGMGWEGDSREGIYICVYTHTHVWLHHIVVWKKPTTL